MNEKQLIETLRSEAKASPITNAVLHLMAMRKRARQTVTISSLYQKMLKEGFTYTRSDYMPVIKAMANAGLGTLVLDSKGRIKGLKGITLKLQSVGAAVVGSSTSQHTIGKLKNRPKFVELTSKAEVLKTEDAKQTPQVDVKLVVIISGKPVEIKIPKDLTANELAEFIKTLTR